MSRSMNKPALKDVLSLFVLDKPITGLSAMSKANMLIALETHWNEIQINVQKTANPSAAFEI